MSREFDWSNWDYFNQEFVLTYFPHFVSLFAIVCLSTYVCHHYNECFSLEIRILKKKDEEFSKKCIAFLTNTLTSQLVLLSFQLSADLCQLAWFQRPSEVQARAWTSEGIGNKTMCQYAIRFDKIKRYFCMIFW